MKVLYIGHFYEGSGWSKAAINYVLAMDSVGIDVAVRSVNLTENAQTNLPFKILKMLKKDTTDCDICIQHVLPHHLVGTDHFKKNISFFVSESTTIQHLAWFPCLQGMDEVWVPNSHLKKSLEDDEIGVPIKVFPHTFNISSLQKGDEVLDIGHDSGNFKFYYIGDLNDRKNISSIIRCFHSEFDRSEPVSLILKVNKYGLSPQEVNNLTSQICTQVKSELRLYPNLEDYHREIIISERVPDEAIVAIHKGCDCFVLSSHGEAWSIPAFEAMAVGNTPVCGNFGGPSDFIDHKDASTGTAISGTHKVCNSSDSAFPEIFTGRESWFEPSEEEMKHQMRHYYENQDTDHSKAGLKRAEKYSYQKIGNQIKEYINE
tara:strand:- start:23602 stop:24723 length:1122 start_codon:yes stop_codon:yes gene_type:complete